MAMKLMGLVYKPWKPKPFPILAVRFTHPPNDSCSCSQNTIHSTAQPASLQIIVWAACVTCIRSLAPLVGDQCICPRRFLESDLRQFG